MKALFIVVLTVFSSSLFAQQKDTLPAATAPQEKVQMIFMDSVKLARKNRLPVPKKALLYSLVLPGAGQVYNGRWWKAPIAVGALGGIAYVYYSNNDLYKRLKTALELELQKNARVYFNSTLGLMDCDRTAIPMIKIARHHLPE